MDRLWVGNSRDALFGFGGAGHAVAVLNLAADLVVDRKTVLYAKCPLVDGPGNSLAAYHGAVLTLHSLRAGERLALVVDHDCSALCATVAAMYLHLCHRMGWDHWIRVISEKVGRAVEPHPAHREAFNRTNWRLLSTVTEGAT